MVKVIDQQLRRNDCGISAVKTVCNLLDVNIGREVISDNILLNEEGSSIVSLKNFMDSYGFDTAFKLLDINSIEQNYEEIKSYLPCITPIKSRSGLHYVVISAIKGNRLVVLNPSKAKKFYYSIQEFKQKAYYSSSMMQYADLDSLLKVQVKTALKKYKIKLPNEPSHQENVALFNKLTYFGYVDENFGFKDEKSTRAFLKDLLFNQDLRHIPSHFEGLHYRHDRKGERVKIKAPILLTVKKNEATREAPSTNTTNVYWRLFKSIANIQDLWFIFLATALLASVIGYVSVFINQILIDHILPSYQMNTLRLFAVGVGVFYLVDMVFYVYKKYISIHLSNALDRFFLSDFDSKLTRYSIRYLQGFKRGDLTERLSDSMRLKSFFVKYFSSILVNVIIAVFSLGFLFMINWKLSLIVLAILSLYIGMYFFFTPIIERLERERFTKKAEFFSRFIEKIDGIQVIKALGLEEYSTNQIRTRINELIDIQTKSKYVSMANGVLSSLIKSFSALALLVLTSQQMIVYNTISLGMIMTFLALSSKIFSAFSSLLNKNLTLQEHKVILNRFFDFDERQTQNTDTDEDDSQKNTSSTTLYSTQNTVQHKITNFQFEKLSIDKVAFSYLDDKYIFKNVSLEIRQGEKIWIHGENGTGKSTLCKIMGLLYEPTIGQIKINDTDISLYHRNYVRKKIIFVSGEDLLFNETLLFNISFGRKIDMQKLIEYARLINFYEFIEKKSDQFDFVIHENGRNLSTGQRKKVLLLRALMTEADLIILDEIFNGIDSYSKARTETLLDLIDDKAFIIISHIPVTGIHFNQKFTLVDGSLLKQNT